MMGDKRRAYISGPINSVIPGLTHEEAKARFHRCEQWINDNLPEWTVVNPLDVGACTNPQCGDYDGHSWECWLRYDLIAMLNCDVIVLLPGWERSAGAVLEAHVAQNIMMTAFHAEENGVIVL